jgi:glycosyltransferase involved in cell wall biosynthesis
VVGVVHPCKVYSAMAVARPILLVGPDPCHVSDLVREHEIGWRITHGDVEGAARTIERIAATPRAELEAMGRRARDVVVSRLGKAALCGAFCDVVERALRTGRSTEESPAPQAASAP